MDFPILEDWTYVYNGLIPKNHGFDSQTEYLQSIKANQVIFPNGSNRIGRQFGPRDKLLESRKDHNQTENSTDDGRIPGNRAHMILFRDEFISARYLMKHKFGIYAALLIHSGLMIYHSTTVTQSKAPNWPLVVWYIITISSYAVGGVLNEFGKTTGVTLISLMAFAQFVYFFILFNDIIHLFLCLISLGIYLAGRNYRRKIMYHWMIMAQRSR